MLTIVWAADARSIMSAAFLAAPEPIPQAVTEYHNMIYYLGERGVYITQYIPSILDTCWNQRKFV